VRQRVTAASQPSHLVLGNARTRDRPAPNTPGDQLVAGMTADGRQIRRIYSFGPGGSPDGHFVGQTRAGLLGHEQYHPRHGRHRNGAAGWSRAGRG
jgi:hypothetical protein